MDTALTLSAIVITYKRPDELEGALDSLLEQEPLPEEIVVWDNDPEASGRQAGLAAHPRVRYLCAGENLGITGGRNRAAAAASGDVLLFLDDDARLAQTQTFDIIRRAFTQPDLACLTFLIRNAFTNAIVPKEYPGYSTADWQEPHPVTYFLGGACAIRRAPFLEAGGFDDVLFYGGEELDLSLRWLDAGWRLAYTPEVEVLHRASAAGREKIHESYRLVRNRLYLAVKHYPWPFVLSHFAIWSGFALLQSLPGGLGDFWRGLYALRREGLWQRALVYRRAHPMRRETLAYLRRHRGRLWY